jgi:hypothetical protein
MNLIKGLIKRLKSLQDRTAMTQSTIHAITAEMKIKLNTWFPMPLMNLFSRGKRMSYDEIKTKFIYPLVRKTRKAADNMDQYFHKMKFTAGGLLKEVVVTIEKAKSLSNSLEQTFHELKTNFGDAETIQDMLGESMFA